MKGNGGLLFVRVFNSLLTTTWGGCPVSTEEMPRKIFGRHYFCIIIMIAPIGEVKWLLSWRSGGSRWYETRHTLSTWHPTGVTCLRPSKQGRRGHPSLVTLHVEAAHKAWVWHSSKKWYVIFVAGELRGGIEVEEYLQVEGTRSDVLLAAIYSK